MTPVSEALVRDIVSFDAPRQPLRLAGAAALLEALAICLPDWTPVPADPGPADISVEQVSSGHRVVCPLFAGGAVEAAEPMHAAGAIAGALTSLYVSQSEDYLLLHAAATAGGTDGGLAIFLGDSRAGKSTLALRLAHLGHRVFADDRLAIRARENGTIECLSLGVAPKARLPLPPESGTDFARFIEEHCAARGKTMAHLYLPPAVKAPLGEVGEGRALIVIDRRGKPTPPRLEPLSASHILRDTLPKCLPSELSSVGLLQRASALVRALPGYRLTFSDSGAAARLVIDAFS